MCFRRSSERTCALLSDRGQPPLRHLQRRLLHAWPPLQGTWPVEIEKRMQRLPCFVAGLQLHDRTDTPLRLLCGTEPAHGAPAAMPGFSETLRNLQTLRNLHRHGSRCQPEAFSNLRTPRHCFKGFGVSDVSVCLNARLPARYMHLGLLYTALLAAAKRPLRELQRRPRPPRKALPGRECALRRHVVGYGEQQHSVDRDFRPASPGCWARRWPSTTRAGTALWRCPSGVSRFSCRLLRFRFSSAARYFRAQPPMAPGRI